MKKHVVEKKPRKYLSQSDVPAYSLTKALRVATAISDNYAKHPTKPLRVIEIGASMALYGRKFILLVEKGVTLPSNLQGLYEVRYEGSALDYAATMKLLKAFNDFRA